MKMQNGGPPEMQNGGTKIAYVNGTLHVDISQYDSDNESQWSSASSYSKSHSETHPLPPLMKKIANQELTEAEKKTLQSFSSLNYSPSHSATYKDWLRAQPARLYYIVEWDRWLLCTVIGILVGLIAALLKQSTTALGDIRLGDLKKHARENDLTMSWCWNYLWTTVYIGIAAIAISWCHPLAAGGGTPEIIAYLNGVLVHGVICLRQLIVKFIGLVFTVSAGFPVGVQGPLIVFGACIGSGIGQFKSRTLGISPPIFQRFRNKEDRRMFTTVGLAAGVSSGFDAPIGSLMLAMEDLSSIWSRRLAAQTFFGAIIAILTAKLFNTAFNGFESDMGFGPLSAELIIPLNIHIATVGVAVVLGIIGGLVGALFTRLSAFCINGRKLLMSNIKSENGKRFFRLFDALLIAMVWCTYGVYFPSAFDCDHFSLSNYSTTAEIHCFMDVENLTMADLGLEQYTCPQNNDTDDVSYNAVASLVQNPAAGIFAKTWKRGTHTWYDWHHCLAVFAIFTLGNIYVTTGCPVAGGVFVPLVVSGSLIGRALGIGLQNIWQLYKETPYPIDTKYWDWMDPGLIAVIGSACMLGGVTRLAIASTVFMVEMSRDIELTIPIMIAALVARTVGEYLSKSLFRYLTDIKGLPTLDQDPKIVINHRLAKLELFEARDVMASPVKTIRSIESLGGLARMLLSHSHGGIPVVRYDPHTRHEIAYGLITRNELYKILLSEEVHEDLPAGSVIRPDIDFSELSIDFYEDPAEAIEKVEKLSKAKRCDEIFIDLERYINLSVQRVVQHFSLYRTYQQFRNLGMRHLLVTDLNNRLVGIITRKDLVQYRMQEKLSQLYNYESECDDSAYTSTSGSSPPSVDKDLTKSRLNGYLNQGYKEDASVYL